MSSPDVLMFKCRFCGTQLSVPVSQAGISGPCPNCGQQITSPTLPDAGGAMTPQMQKIARAQVPNSPPISVQSHAWQEQAAGAREPTPTSHWGGMMVDDSSIKESTHREPRKREPLGQSHSAMNSENRGIPGRHKTMLPVRKGRAEGSISHEDDHGHEDHHGWDEEPQTYGDDRSRNQGGKSGGLPTPGQARPWSSVVHENRRIMEPAARPWAGMTSDFEDLETRSKRRSTLFFAVLLLMAALVGVGFVFENQLRVIWHSYRLNFGLEEAVVVSEETPSSEVSVDETTASAAEEPTKAAPVPELQVEPQISTPAQSMQEVEMPSVPPHPEVEPESAIMNSVTPVKAVAVDEPGNPAATEEKSMVVEVLEEAEVASREKPVPQLFSRSPEKIREAVEALKLFLYAEDWRQRVRYSQHEDEIRSLMEQYYRTGKDGPIHVDEVQSISGAEPALTDDGKRHVVFQLIGGDVGTVLPVMVEEGEKGWKVDWLTFIEGKDRLLEKFYAGFVDAPARFRVLARRKRYFEKDVPDVDSKLCFELQAPAPGFMGYAFVDGGIPLAKELDRILGWDVISAALILELQWKRSGDMQWVEVTGIPSLNWRMPNPQAQVEADVR